MMFESLDFLFYFYFLCCVGIDLMFWCLVIYDWTLTIASKYGSHSHVWTLPLPPEMVHLAHFRLTPEPSTGTAHSLSWVKPGVFLETPWVQPSGSAVLTRLLPGPCPPPARPAHPGSPEGLQSLHPHRPSCLFLSHQHCPMQGSANARREENSTRDSLLAVFPF